MKHIWIALLLALLLLALCACDQTQTHQIPEQPPELTEQDLTTEPAPQTQPETESDRHVTLLPGIEDTTQDPLRPNYALANCRKLQGNPIVVLLFVDDDESSWTTEQAQEFMKEHVLPGLDYLEKQARAWGVALDFTVESHGATLNSHTLKYEGVVTRDLFATGSTKDVLDQAAADMGFDGNWEIYSYYQTEHPEQDIIFLHFLNKSGRSYTRHGILPGYYEYTEHCVIFAYAPNTTPSQRKAGERASTVAHELLHLFGAEDFYTSASREQLANQHYPHDIMLWQYDRIESNTLGHCTAFSVGWTYDVPNVCYDDAWWQ